MKEDEKLTKKFWLLETEKSILRTDSLIKLYKELSRARFRGEDSELVEKRISIVKRQALEECLEVRALLKKFTESAPEK
ncbi:MAG: hypothetical protein NTV63_02420 [Candidatus Woesearchaeota archaeon]|nr:hypothetical protein [Candidatus Woesearchaeota archaeon]